MVYGQLQETDWVLKGLLDAELDKDEQLGWSGQPRPGRFARQYLPVALFGILFGGFAVFWTCMALFGVRQTGEAGPMRLLFPLWGLPFILVGLSMLCSPLWGLRQAKRTLYAVTDRRAIIIRRGFSVRISSYKAEQVGEHSKRLRNDGSGDLIFDQLVDWSAGQSDNGRPLRKVGFFGIENVNEVEDLLNEIGRPAD